MNKSLFSIPVAVFAFLVAFSASAQTNFIERKAGHQYYLAVPDYLNKTIGLNDVATAQYKNQVKEAYVIVIEDSKEELAIVELSYSSPEEFYNSFIDSFLADLKKRKVGKATSSAVGDVKFVQSEASYYDEETKSTINYFVTVAETKTHFYKILCWTDDKNKEKLRPDFDKLAKSIKD